MLMNTNANGRPCRPHPSDLKGPTRDAWAWIIAQPPLFLWFSKGDLTRLQANTPSPQPQRVDWAMLLQLIKGRPPHERRGRSG